MPPTCGSKSFSISVPLAGNPGSVNSICGIPLLEEAEDSEESLDADSELLLEESSELPLEESSELDDPLEIEAALLSEETEEPEETLEVDDSLEAPSDDEPNPDDSPDPDDPLDSEEPLELLLREKLELEVPLSPAGRLRRSGAPESNALFFPRSIAVNFPSAVFLPICSILGQETSRPAPCQPKFHEFSFGVSFSLPSTFATAA